MVGPRQEIESPLDAGFSRADAVDLLAGLVGIPSLSYQEADAVRWLADRMALYGYQRAFVDESGNAVGELGLPSASRTIVLLGHIDTVPGSIPVRIESRENGDILHGRGSVDAKGPLASFVAAAARVGGEWAIEHDVRIVVVGAVEEEAATSKGARHIRARFDGNAEPIPDACVIGEPSSAHRVTLGYKGRLLVEMEASQPMAHTAGPDAGVATLAVDFWNWISGHAVTFNAGRSKSFEQLLPSLRELRTETDDEMNDRVVARAGVRLPLRFDVCEYASALARWAADAVQAPQLAEPDIRIGEGSAVQSLVFVGEQTTITLHFRGYEAAWRSDRNNALVRSFLSAVRTVDPGARPGFVVKTGTSDMNVVGPAWQCPIVAYGPGDSSLDHTPMEHLELDEYWRAILVLEQTVRNLFP